MGEEFVADWVTRIIGYYGKLVIYYVAYCSSLAYSNIRYWVGYILFKLL